MMNEAAGLARKWTIAAAISSGRPKRPSGDGGGCAPGGELAGGRVHVGVGGAGLHDVDGDALGPGIARPALGVGGHSGLGGRVVGDAGVRRTRAARPEPTVMMRPPSPMTFEAARTAATTPPMLIAI